MESEFVPENDTDNTRPELSTLKEKLKRLQAELRECQKDKQEYLAMAQRLKADYLNSRREAEAGRQAALEFATEPVLLDLLELADNFELAFANREAWQKVDENWRRGIEYIYSKLQKVFEKYGLEEIPSVGQPFDPLKHHAVEMIESADSQEANQVKEVIQKGYTLRGKVVRPAQVKVVNS